MRNLSFTHDVIVCVHNSLSCTQDCLKSLVRHWDADKQNRLIITDDCSDDETKDYLQQFGSENEFVDVIFLKKQHFYTKAANIGLRASHAQLRTLLNSDTVVTQGWAEKIQNVFLPSEFIGIVGPLSNAASTQSLPFVKSSKTQTAINSLPSGVSIDSFGDFIEEVGRGKVTPFVPLLHGACLTIRSNVIEEIGYFDEKNFPCGYGEENDYCFRAEDAGYILAIALDLFIFHVKSASYESKDQIDFMQAGMKNFSKKHGAERIKKSIHFMETNPYLQEMRDAVLKKWPRHYTKAMNSQKFLT